MKSKLLLALVFFYSSQIHAAIDNLSSLEQQEFEQLTQDLGAGLHYKAITPAEPLGILGFDVGVAVSRTELEHPELWRRVDADGDSHDYLNLTRLQAHKGLPFGLDVGASYSVSPGNDMRVIGAELRYAIWEGGILWPALAVRGTYAKTVATEVFDSEHTGIELSISKGMLMFTPYAGVGLIRTHNNPEGTALDAVSISQTKLFIGTNVNFLGINGAAELDDTDGRATISLKLGIRF
jgi:hypothetical protein